MPGPLDGVRILEFTEIIAGPFGGMLLSDMGAEVIKVEPPWGEPWRFAQEFLPNESKTYMSLNRGKKSLPLDLTKPEGQEVVHRLIESIDVVVINARPDVPYNLNIDYETLSAINPRIIYCENTAFGSSGPQNYRPGYDIIVQAATGMMTSEGKVKDGVPQQIQATAVADYSAGLAIAWGVCAALFHRERTGVGQKVESTLLGTALALQGSRFIKVDSIDNEPRAELLDSLNTMRDAGTRYEDLMGYYHDLRVTGHRVGNIYYRTYQTKDGALAVGCLSNRLRMRLADVLGVDDIRFKPGYDPSSDEAKEFGDKLIATAEHLMMQKTVAEWLELLDKAGVPAGPVRFVEELLDDDQVASNGLAVDLEHSLAGSLTMVGPMIKMNESPLEAQGASPALGEHSAEILREAGYSDEQIDHLIRDGITL